MTDLALIARIGEHRIAFDASLIESVIDLGPVAAVPLGAPHIAGLAAARSRVLTVIDTAVALGLPGSANASRAIVMVLDGHRYALRVDAVEDVAAPTGISPRVDAPVGLVWRAAAIATIDTASGYALLLDPARIVAGPSAIAA